MDEQPTTDAVDAVSLREAARRLGHDREHPLSVQTVQNWLKRGRLSGRKDPRPNGQEKWVVLLPSDEAELDRLRSQLRRPDQPAAVVFPGPAPTGPDPRDEEIRFLREELAARRHEVEASSRLLASALEALARVAEPKALPAPTARPWYWWLAPWREWEV
jgi:hypothetical protein